MTEKPDKEIVLQGIAGSPGICIGKAYLVDKGGVDVVRKYRLADDRLEAEMNRFRQAVQKAKEELHQILSDTPEELRDHARILESHVVLLKDKMLYGRTIDIIQKEKVNADWALKKTVDRLRAMFESMADPYLKARAVDIVHVAERIMEQLTGDERVDIGKIEKRVILVASDLSPAETSQIQLEWIKGFVTARGGRTSHTSIIARSLQIPAVLGIEEATRVIHNDDIIIVDGTAGLVIINPSEQTLLEAGNKMALYEARRARMARESRVEAKTVDGVHLAVMGNIELPEEVVSVIDNGGDGIGLYRTEFQYLARKSFPSEEEMYEKYKDVVDVMPDKPVTIRTLDINGDKAVVYGNGEYEANPALGLRAIRYCLQKPEVFKTQLRAIMRAAAHGQVRILIPMISCLEEIIATRKLIDEAAESLAREGGNFDPDLPLGMMIEVPSTVIMADRFAKEVDFFSIGTNDLIQYAMAIDRGNRLVAHLYSHLKPPVLRLLDLLCRAAHANKVPVYMCGEMAGDPLCTPFLIGLGISELSMNPASIPVVKKIIRNLDSGQARIFKDKLLEQATAKEAESLVRSTYGDLLAEIVENGKEAETAHG